MPPLANASASRLPADHDAMRNGAAAIGLVAILITSAIPVFGLLQLGWRSFDVAMALWLDGLAKLVVIVLMLLVAKEGLILGLVRGAIYFYGIGIALLGHLFGIMALLADRSHFNGPFATLLELGHQRAWQFVVATVLVCHLYGFATGYLRAGALRPDLANLAVRELHLRIWIVQLAVLGMAYLVIEKGVSAIGGLLAMILLKTGSDLYFEWRKYRIYRQGA